MYQGATTRIRTVWSTTSSFSATVGDHQGSTFSPYLFIMLMNDLLTGGGRSEEQVPRFMHFADDIAQLGNSHADLKSGLKSLQQTLEGNGQWIIWKTWWEEGRWVRLILATCQSTKLRNSNTWGAWSRGVGGNDGGVIERVDAGQWNFFCSKQAPIKLAGRDLRMLRYMSGIPEG